LQALDDAGTHETGIDLAGQYRLDHLVVFLQNLQILARRKGDSSFQHFQDLGLIAAQIAGARYAYPFALQVLERVDVIPLGGGDDDAAQAAHLESVVAADDGGHDTGQLATAAHHQIVRRVGHQKIEPVFGQGGFHLCLLKRQQLDRPATQHFAQIIGQGLKTLFHDGFGAIGKDADAQGFHSGCQPAGKGKQQRQQQAEKGGAGRHGLSYPAADSWR